MQLTFTVAGKPLYMLVKLDPGWELKKFDVGGRVIEKGIRTGEKTTSGWKKMAKGNGQYPHTIRHALDLIADDIILSHGNEQLPVVDGLRLIRQEIGKLEHTLDALAEDSAI